MNLLVHKKKNRYRVTAVPTSILKDIRVIRVAGFPLSCIECPKRLFLLLRDRMQIDELSGCIPQAVTTWAAHQIVPRKYCRVVNEPDEWVDMHAQSQSETVYV